MVIEELVQRLNGRKSGEGWLCHCPVPSHGRGRGDVNPSLFLREQGREIRFNCFAGCAPSDVRMALGLDGAKSNRQVAATYDYLDENGKLLYQIVRFAPKGFRVRRPDGNGGWVWGLGEQKPILYRLNELAQWGGDEWIFITEGEKDADKLISLGLRATTNPFGAGKWREEFNRWFEGKRVAIVPDNDPPGRKHAEGVAENLRGVAKEIKLVQLPGLEDGQDVSDWLSHGHTKEDLLQLVEKSENLTSNYKDEPLEVRLEVNAGELRRRAIEEPGVDNIEYLPFLGQERFIAKGWAHIIAGYPKSGKTELIIRVAAEWANESVLLISEEPEGVWRARLSRLPHLYCVDHITIRFGIGMERAKILDRVNQGDETVVVIDTIRNLLRLTDETNNSEVAHTLIPFIDLARKKGQTLLFLHHVRKGGGDHGEGIAGGHSFLGAVDVAIELLRDGQSPMRRKVRGWARVFPVPELIYEMDEDGVASVLGSPEEVCRAEVRKRILDVMDGEDWKKTDEIHQALAEPRPSKEQVRKVLVELAREGEVERKPPITEEARGKTHWWRRSSRPEPHFQRPTLIVGSEVESPNLGKNSSPPSHSEACECESCVPPDADTSFPFDESERRDPHLDSEIIEFDI